jgi:hypothetical protein
MAVGSELGSALRYRGKMKAPKAPLRGYPHFSPDSTAYDGDQVAENAFMKKQT